MKKNLPCAFATAWLWLAVAAAAAAQPGPPGAVAQEVRALTGAPTRIVWVQHTGDGTDIFARGDHLRLLGLDTEDGRGEREIVPGEGGFSKPLITHSGNQVVFCNFVTQTTSVVNWDGSGLRELSRGILAAVWMDPATRAEWVYVQVGRATGVDARNNPIWRFRLDASAAAELVWDKTPVNPEGFQVFQDGRRAVSLFPWPHFGVAALPNESVVELGQGCCVSLASETGDLAFHLLGDHRHLMMYSLRGQEKWKVALNQAPGVDGFEVYHPKWSNRNRFLAMCGPFTGGGGITAEIYLGRFNQGLTAVEDWVRVTANDKGDFFPDVWVVPSPALEVRYTLSGLPVVVPAAPGAN